MLESHFRGDTTKEQVMSDTESLLDMVAADIVLPRQIVEYYRNWIKNSFRTIFLYGGGNDGYKIAECLAPIFEGKDVYFIDGNEAKHGKEIYPGIVCYGPEKMYGCDENTSIILFTTHNHADELYDKYLGSRPWDIASSYQVPGKIGKTYVDKSFVKYFFRWRKYCEKDRTFSKDKILKASALLDDVKSCFVLYRLLFSRLIGNQNLRDITTYPQYFPEEWMPLFTNAEVFLDCGAYTGDTALVFKKLMQDQFAGIYLFEMDRKPYEKLLKSSIMRDPRTRAWNCGISNREGYVSYQRIEGASSYVMDRDFADAEERARLVTIDGMIESGEIEDNITFVKMDIEGAENDALHGMQNLIVKRRPKLAISVYHKNEDLWEIPLYLHQIVPEYKFFLRTHHPCGMNWETVLYAYIP